MNLRAPATYYALTSQGKIYFIKLIDQDKFGPKQ